jgi:nuclear pore complex protein Nup54
LNSFITKRNSIMSLFGNTTSNQGGGLFGASQQQQPQQQQQQQQQQSGGLFGQSTANAPAPQNQSVFAQQQTGNPLAGTLSAGFGANHTGAMGAQSQRELAQSRLDAAGLNSVARTDKSPADAMAVLITKWDPNDQRTSLQKYLYNAVNPAYAPYYHPAPGESEREWETALSNKPKGDADTAYVPVQVRGFEALGKRLELQGQVLNRLQQNLHEMNNSLAAIMAKHQQDISVRIETSKRQHAAIAQRTLRLAIKCQILRNRGYTLDGTEETLRRNVLDLNKQIQDPSFSSREEEIWARMVGLRERARWLEEEGKRVGAATAEAQRQEGNSLPENVLQGANRILRDYDGQLAHLAKELEEVKKEYQEWEAEKRR